MNVGVSFLRKNTKKEKTKENTIEEQLPKLDIKLCTGGKRK